jgi:hypothetical protein
VGYVRHGKVPARYVQKGIGLSMRGLNKDGLIRRYFPVLSEMVGNTRSKKNTMFGGLVLCEAQSREDGMLRAEQA